MHHNYRSCLRSGCCCCGTVFGVRAYNDYTLQQQTEERIKSIDDTYADFLDETDRSKKLEKLSDFIKNKPSTNDEIAVEVLNHCSSRFLNGRGRRT